MESLLHCACAVHEIVKGKALGIRVKGKRGTEELDVYLVSANAPVVQSGDADTVGAAHHSFWQSFERGIRRVPRRSVLIIGIDANVEVGSSLPWVWDRWRTLPWDALLYTLAKDHGWKLQNTFGHRRAEQWTWQHPQGGRHRINYFCVRLATRATPARTIYEAPVAFSGFRDHRPLVMTVPMTAAVKSKRNVQRQLAWDRTKLCDAQAAWKDWKLTCNEGGEISRDPLALQFQNDLEQHLFRKLSGLTPMQAFNTIEHAVVEVGLLYFAAPSRRGGRRQPTLTSSTLALVRQKQQLAREMARLRHETWPPLEAEALRANYDEAVKHARTAGKKDKISNLESLARTAEEAHKDRDPRTVYQVIRRLAPPARLPTRTVRCIATGEPCRHKQHEMEDIEKAMCQIYKGTSRPLEWQALAPPRRRRCGKSQMWQSCLEQSSVFPISRLHPKSFKETPLRTPVLR